MQRGRHLLILCRNTAEFSGPEVIWDGPKDSGNTFSVQTSPHFSLFLEKNGHWILRAKDEKDHPDCYQTKSAKTSLCDGMGVHQCPRHGWSAYMWRYHWCGGLCWNFGDICCRQDDFSQELHFYFSRTMPGLILHEFQQHGFVGIECVCLTGLPAVQICLILKMCGRIMKRRIRQWRPSWAAQVLYTPRMGKNSTYLLT